MLPVPDALVGERVDAALARMLGARLPKQQLAAAALIGASVMMTADWLGRQVMFPYEVPAGMMATLIGGAYFMMMMRKL